MEKAGVMTQATEGAHDGWPLRWVVAILGPTALGACLTAFSPGTPAWELAARVPGLSWGLAALTVPALYIGLAYLGTAPAAGRMASAALGGLYASGLLLLGLVPAVAFLAATVTTPRAAQLVGALAFALAGLAGLQRFFATAFADEEGGVRRTMALIVWTAVTGGLGLHLYATVVLA